MAASQEETHRIPVICLDPATVAGADIFDPNACAPDSKGLIYSCLAEYSVLHHCVEQIGSMCKDAARLCDNQLHTFQEQWIRARFDLEKVMLLGEQPDLHMRIEAFFSGAKSLLDLVVQLLSIENVVTARVHGFHRANNVYGGAVLNVLKNNAKKERRDVAEAIAELIHEHKATWIDQLINARDQLIHPEKGMHQLMFHFECADDNGRLACKRINPPMIGAVPIDEYAAQIREEVRGFSKSFLKLLRGVAVSNSSSSGREEA